MFFNILMDKEDMIKVIKKNENSVVCNNIDAPRGYYG